jgi:hypothetical protein
VTYDSGERIYKEKANLNLKPGETLEITLD